MEVITTEILGSFFKLFYLERIINSCIRVSIWGKIQKFKTIIFFFFYFYVYEMYMYVYVSIFVCM